MGLSTQFVKMHKMHKVAK